MASTFIASFAFVGIETIAATAREAQSESPPKNSDTLTNGTSDVPQRPAPSVNDDYNPFKGILWVPFVVTCFYIWGGWIVSQNVVWDDERLFKLKGSSDSIFVFSALDFDNHGAAYNSCEYNSSSPLSRAIAGLLIINLVSTSSTVLYVASRTLFGLAYAKVRKAEAKPIQRQTMLLWIARKLARTSDFNVPFVAVLASTFLLFLPFIKYKDHGVLNNGRDTANCPTSTTAAAATSTVLSSLSSRATSNSDSSESNQSFYEV